MIEENVSAQSEPIIPSSPRLPRKRFKLLKWGLLIFFVLLVLSQIASKQPPVTDSVQPSSTQDTRLQGQKPLPTSTPVRGPNDCNVKSLTKSQPQGLKVPSHDGKKYILNKEDYNGIGQIYIGDVGSTALTCITCTQQPGGPKADRFKMQPVWHPSGRWIFLAVERDEYTPPPILGLNRDYVEGQLQNGIWTNMWAVSPDGTKWFRFTDFKTGVAGTPDGYTGPAFTADGKKLAWSQIVDGNVFVYSFGRWELMLADFVESNGVPKITNHKNITSKEMHWNEPGNFSPDNESLLITGSVEADAQGMDQYILNIRTGALTNLNNSPTVWDEHGVFSPSGEKIFFMSAYPYRDNPDSSKIFSIKTEFMLMNKDGSNITQLTHFKQPGYPEYQNGIAAVGVWSLDGRSMSTRTLNFPNYVDWDIVYEGPCGL